MSYVVLFTFKSDPPYSCVPELDMGLESDLCLSELEARSGVFLLGDGHSSHRLVAQPVVKDEAVKLNDTVVEFFRCAYLQGCYPSMLVSYATGRVLDLYAPTGKAKLGLDQLNEEYLFKERIRYSIV